MSQSSRDDPAAAEMWHWLDRFDAWLREHDPDAWEEKAPGATPEEIQEFEARLGFNIPPELKALYTYSDGFGEFAGWLFNFHQFMPLDSAFNNWAGMNEVHYSGSHFLDARPPFDQAPNRWNQRWIPFAYDGSGGFWCLDCCGSFGGHYGQIVRCSNDASWRSIEHASLAKLFETVVTLLEEGLFQRSEDSFHPGFQIDVGDPDTDRRWRQINRRHPKMFPAEEGTLEHQLGIAKYPEHYGYP